MVNTGAFKKKVLYFAYGSNLSIERLIKRVGKVKHCGSFKIGNHKLAFNVGTDFTSFANIIPSEGDVIEGVVYEITYAQLLVLDRYEGLYERLYIEPSSGRFKGRKIHIYCGWFTRPEFSRPITQEYYDAIYKGAKANNLQKLVSYMEKEIKSHIETEEDKYLNYYKAYGWY